MAKLTQAGQDIVQNLANQHGFSIDAVTHMFFAVLNGNGSMAQFNHPEFGGSGQWMQGGMLMLGDMFNSYLKGRVDSLCYDIAAILANQPNLLQTGSFQSQSQGNINNNTTIGAIGNNNLLIPDANQNWWPQTLGMPSALGSQNNMHYAYFANSHRLAVKTNNEVWVYDTLDHQIGGFSQQQGMGSDILFTSQYGTVNLNTLPVISSPYSNINQSTTNNIDQNNTYSNASSAILTTLEKLGELHSKGIITEEEFMYKKKALLDKL